MSDHKLILIEKARKVLRGEQLPAAELGKLRRELEANDQFGYAAEILLRKMKYDEERNQSVSTREYQDLARYLYKDTSLPAVLKFEKALQRLHVNLELDQSEDYETLGLAGAVYKRKWQYDHQFRNLVLSRYYYGKGFEYWKRNLDQQPKDPDAGYTAINYAYICELMAVDKLAETGQVTGWSEEIAADLETALDTRELLVKLLPERYGAEPESWVLATLAEAFFGLGRYSEAQVYIKKYLERKTQPWELRSFNQQLVSLACLQMSCKQTPGGESLSDVLKAFRGRVGIADINSCLDLFQLPGKSNNRELRQEGKYGLALSGGGFRASLFHIGVLAALAEQDRLKDLEVLSCVSGGSIVGAFYYLKLKVLFEAKTDRQIDKYDYIRLVGEIEQEFLKGVQQNLRMRIFGNLIKNIRMAFDTGYSRTHRLGELYETHLYRDILLKRDKDLNPDGRYDALLKRNKDQLFMSDLYINPLLEEGETFAFGTDNWKRKNRIPQLVLNATSVNTAHNWQFTASWMGEPPGNIQPDIDMKPRLRRMYYPDAPEPFRKFRLGYAVGASSCVPVMFHPMPMKGLYPDIDLQLVDGGLHDNQGIAALLEQECRNLFISDASGQLPTQSGSIKNEASVFYRSDSILQERLRELQFLDVRERSNTLQLDSVCTVHLKSGLQRDPENWTDCTEPTRTVYLEAAENRHNDLTNYGVLRQVQQHLSELRTDLDAFTEAEAYALMYSGWCQVRTQQQVTDMPAQWQFLQAADCLTMPVPARKISPHLEAGKNLFFKLWYVSPVIRYSLITIGILVGLILLRYTAVHWDSNCTLLDLSLTIRTVAVLVGLYLLGMVSELLAKVLNYKSYLKRQLITLIVAMAGFVVCWFYVTFLNPVYIRSGKLSRFS